MRNGNAAPPYYKSIDELNGSYPTYEEWKPKVMNYYTIFSYRSYPTYEEWKQSH